MQFAGLSQPPMQAEKTRPMRNKIKRTVTGNSASQAKSKTNTYCYETNKAKSKVLFSRQTNLWNALAWTRRQLVTTRIVGGKLNDHWLGSIVSH
jgi:hypothetical protein